MRIVEACVRYPPAPGGAESHVAAITAGLRARGHEVTVLATDLRQEVPFERGTFPDEPGVRRFAASTMGGEAHYVWSPRQYAALARAARDAEVVHAHSYGYGHTVAALAAARMAGKPFVFTPHYHPPWSMEGGAKRGRLRKVYDRGPGRWTLQSADAVVAVSFGEADLLRPVVSARSGPPALSVIPNGVDLSRFEGRPDVAGFRARFDLDGPYVLYAGRLAKNKGLDVLLTAFGRVVREHPYVELVFAGADQDQQAALAARADRMQVDDRVTFAGHLSEADYRAALAGCACLALPSEWEAFGLVLVEAMASGRPVVAARVGGTPDVVEDGVTGFLVPHGDAGALADRLGRILGDPLLADRMGAAGRERARRFTWDACVDRLEALFERVRRSR